MANYNNIAASSGFSEPVTLDAKYYNKYTSDNVNTACNGGECLSHGLSETSGWYNDYHNMVSETYPWLVRGVALEVMLLQVYSTLFVLLTLVVLRVTARSAS